MTRILVLALPLFVSGCLLPANLTVVAFVANGLSVVSTGKGATDYALSALSQRDCAILRVAKAESVCRGSGTESPEAAAAEERERRALERNHIAGPDPQASLWREPYLDPGAAALAQASPR